MKSAQFLRAVVLSTIAVSMLSACSAGSADKDEPSETELTELYVPWFDLVEEGRKEQLKMAELSTADFVPWKAKKVEKKKCVKLTVKEKNILKYDCGVYVTYAAESHRDGYADRTLRVLIDKDTNKIEIEYDFLGETPESMRQ